jgi:hypothetical protein
VNVPSVTLTTGLAGVLSGGSGKTAGAEIARKALLAAPAVPAVSLFLTTVLTMTAFHTTVLTGVAALLLTGVPAIWQGLTLTHLRSGAGSSFVQATGDSPSVQSSGTVSKKPGNTRLATTPSHDVAPLDPIAFEEAASAAMEGLFMETAARMAGIEARRVALALGLNPEAEAALHQRLSEVFVSDAKGNDHEEIPGHEKAETPKENLAQRVRRTITEYLTATVPEKVDLWRTQLRQREETEIEKIASDAFHATASYVDLTPDQKNALFEKCSAGARELYATPWSNSAQMGVNIRPQQTERLEEDPAILQEVLTPAQLNDWQTLSASQHEFYDSMPRRITGRLFSFASGPQLAAFLRSTLQDDSNSSSGPEPPLIILDKEVEPAPK